MTGPALLLLLLASVEGSWIGTLDFGFQKLRLVLHVSSAGGKLTATADSPDQGAKGIAVTTIEQDGEEVRFAIAPLSAAYSGRFAEGEIRGAFSQGGVKVPLHLRPLKAGDVEVKRPQIPRKPYPYLEQEVTFENPRAAGVKLSGTLTVPAGEGKWPVVAMLSGSGPQTRDEEVAGHPVFLVLADALTRAGVAVLRYDDRGVGKSTGQFAAATTDDFASDAEAAAEFLSRDRRFRKVGLLGHSEGGIAAPVVAARNPKVRFLVLLAPATVPGREIILAQKEAILRASGVASPDLSQDRAVFDAIAAGKDPESLIPAGTPKSARDSLQSPWFRHFLVFDPAPALRRVRVPVLALFGEKDLQVLPRQNEPVARAALAGNRKASVEVMAGVNHLFQTAKTGLPTEYGQIEETMNPAAIERVVRWVAAQR